MSDQPIVFLDTETDGVHPGRRPWEVAMIRREGDREQEIAFYVEIDLATADPFGLKIGRFYDRHPVGRWLSGAIPAGFPRFPEVDPGRTQPTAEGLVSREAAARLVAQWTHGATIIGMCPNFDTECLSWMLAEHGLTPSWHYSLVDVETLAAGFLRHLELENMTSLRKIEPDAKFLDSLATLPFDSDKITHALYVDPPSDEERHTALGDARWCARLYDAVMTE